MKTTRRTLLVRVLPGASLAAFAAACGGGHSEPRVSGKPLATSAPANAAATVVQGPLDPALFELPAQPVMQGGTFVAVLKSRDLVNATVEFAGNKVQTVHDNGFRMAIVATGQPVAGGRPIEAGTHPIKVTFQLPLDQKPQELAGKVTVTAADYPTVALQLPNGVSALPDAKATDQETAVLREAYNGVTPLRIWDGFFQRPNTAAVAVPYGARRTLNGSALAGGNSGVEFAVTAGSPVQAAAAGRVKLARALPFRGNLLIIDHGSGVFTGYGNLAGFNVEEGQDVNAGQTIATSGQSGFAAAPTLRWEVVAGGMFVDGMRWLKF